MGYKKKQKNKIKNENFKERWEEKKNMSTFSFFESQKLVYLHWVVRLKWNETKQKKTTKRNREDFSFFFRFKIGRRYLQDDGALLFAQ